MQRRAVFLDRDGTIIVDKIYLNDPDQVEFLPGAIEGLRLLQEHGFILLGATNQSGVPRGLVQIENLNEIHRRICAELARHGVDLPKFFYAPYMTDSNHPLRKPNPGMLLEGAEEFRVDLKKSWMIGDRMTDVEAGHRAGCKTVLLGDSENPADFDFAPPEIQTKDLLEAAGRIILLS